MRCLRIATFIMLAGTTAAATLAGCASNRGGAGRASPANANDSAAATIRDTLDAAGTLDQIRGDSAPDTTARPDTTTSR